MFRQFRASRFVNFRLLLPLLIAGAVVLAAANPPRSAEAADGLMVEIYVDGGSRTVITEAATVGDVLEDAGVELGLLDLVEPGLGTPLGRDGFHINVYRAHPVMVVDGDHRFTITTPYSSPHLIAKSAGLEVYPEDRFGIELVREFVAEGFIGQKLIITRATPVTVELDGQTFTLRTHQPTVGELLNEKGIVLVSEDFTSIPTSAPITPGLSFKVVRVGHEIVAEEQPVPFETRLIIDLDVPYGTREVRQAGKPGRIITSYEVLRHDGQEVSRRLIGTAKVSDPVPQIVVKGRRILSVYTTNEQILGALAECESHGNYSADTGNGFYGAYQFSAATWNHWKTGYAYAHLAPAGVQDATVLRNARASSGGFWSQHPGCSSYLHLPKFPL